MDIKEIIQSGINDWLKDVEDKCEKKLWANIPFSANIVIQAGKLIQITVEGVHHKL